MVYFDNCCLLLNYIATENKNKSEFGFRTKMPIYCIFTAG